MVVVQVWRYLQCGRWWLDVFSERCILLIDENFSCSGNLEEEGILYKDNDKTKKRTIDKEYNDDRVDEQKSKTNNLLLLLGFF